MQEHKLLPTTAADTMGASVLDKGSTRNTDKRRVFGLPLTNAIAAIWALLSFAAYVAFTRDQRTNGAYGCEMAYMWPTYHRVEWPGSDKERYSVYLYREGGTDPQKAIGIPVIFLPGNAGSFKQVRSIASSTSRLFFNDAGEHGGDRGSWGRPLDFFAFDFNEDFSAFHAPTLEDQARFVAAAIPHINASYAGGEQPKKVMLVGHSMGGVVARLAAQYMANSTISSILTMSTPHTVPPISFDRAIDNIYTKINSASHAAPAPVLVSICGGVSDTQIVSDSCALPNSVIGPEDGFAVFSTDIPAVWTGVEHQTMVWCDQVRWRVARALLDMANAQLRPARLKAAKKWLLSGADSATSAHRTTTPSSWVSTDVPVEASAMSLIVSLHTSETDLAEPPLRVQHCDGGSCGDVRWTARPVPRPQKPSDPFPFVGEGVKVRESAFVLDLVDLPARGRLRVFTAPGARITGGPTETHRVGGSWHGGDTTPAHVALEFLRPVSSLLAWRLETELRSPCTSRRPIIHHEARPAHGYDLSFESRYYPNRGPITLHSHVSGAPFHPSAQSSTGIEVHIYQEPGCTIKSARISLDWGATLAKAMLRFRVPAITWGSGWVAWVLYKQLEAYHATGTLPTFAATLEAKVKYSALFIGGALVLAPIGQHLFSFVIDKEKLVLGSAELMHVPFSLLFAFWSLGLVVVVQRLQAACIAVAARYLRRGRDAPAAPGIGAAGSKLRYATHLVPSLVLLALAKLFIPWRMAFVMLYIIQFCLVARSAHDENASRHNLLASTLLAMTFLLPLAVPAIAVWARNLWNNHGHPFAADHALLPLIPVLAAVQLGSQDGPLADTTKKVRRAFSMLSPLAVVFAAFVRSGRETYFLITAADIMFAGIAVMLAGSSTGP